VKSESEKVKKLFMMTFSHYSTVPLISSLGRGKQAGGSNEEGYREGGGGRAGGGEGRRKFELNNPFWIGKLANMSTSLSFLQLLFFKIFRSYLCVYIFRVFLFSVSNT